jgi:hypothetical protein
VILLHSTPTKFVIIFIASTIFGIPISMLSNAGAAYAAVI